MPDGTTTEVKRGRKFDQVLDGAREVFMSDGYEGASVDDIARAAGVSKATLYSYFPDKRLLFLEMAKSECCRQAELAATQVDMDRPPRTVLTEAAGHMVDFLTSEFGLRVFRLCVAESERFPQLGREFFEGGPMKVRNVLVHYFRLAAGRGELKIEDFDLAADQFHQLCKTDLFHRLIFSISDVFTAAEKRRVIEGAVDMFLARYGVE